MMENPPVNVPLAGEATQTGKNYKEMLKEPNFWILWAVYAFVATSGMMVIGHAANLASYYSLGTGAIIVMVVGLANTLGRIFWGSVSDKLGRYKTVMMMFVVSGTGPMLLNFTTTLGKFAGILGLIFIALSFGGFLGSFPGITAENWGASKSASNYGWMFTAYGIAAIFGPSLASSIRESTGSYSMALVISAGMAVIGATMILWYMKRLEKNYEYATKG
ncbi:Oxalate:formate antiporter [Jeotgalibaca dankookensis]|uniref:Oxalate:formate antiporter n=1 Tax=Jeotgalibaca dankookensis TaxID=708126 RepID=A0A1S6IP93_9LACT|nr:Oxalate:formate antiporter [Jeotgalibaca dankookensis]